jgi:hypothetical protein
MLKNKETKALNLKLLFEGKQIRKILNWFRVPGYKCFNPYKTRVIF